MQVLNVNSMGNNPSVFSFAMPAVVASPFTHAELYAIYSKQHLIANHNAEDSLCQTECRWGLKAPRSVFAKTQRKTTQFDKDVNKKKRTALC